MSESSRTFNQDTSNARTRHEAILAMIDEAVADNEVVMRPILFPGEVGAVAVVGYRASEL